MSGNEIGKVCYFCSRNNLGLFKKELPTTKIIICQGCCKSLTIEGFNKAFKSYNLKIQTLTLIEITNDNNTDFKPTNQ